jgi:uncharacterized surface protein with fasciclin (FAS1) repeats
MKKLMITTSIVSILFAVSPALACDACGCSATKARASAESAKLVDIVQTAVSAGQFKTLVAAIQAAGLEEALNGKGPFTVFALTDEAFAKLPAGTVESLVQPKNKAKLQAILKYHVVPARVRSHDILAAHTVKTLNG